nr:GNAT family N-acetyltransferase [Providencia stuartii]
MALVEKLFSSIDLSDPFFDSLKIDYPEFEDWFNRKRDHYAIVSINDSGRIDGFLYLKEEDESLDDMDPSFPKEQRLKCGTFKIDGHGTKLGERFVSKLINCALEKRIKTIYVTIFDKHDGLINLLKSFGFELCSRKLKETPSGREGVYFKRVTKWY